MAQTDGNPAGGNEGTTGTTKREILSWCAYDFANSAYTTLIVTVAFSVYFVEVVAPGADGTRLWGRGYSASMLILAFFAPFIGAVADYGGYKKRFLVGFTLLSVLATALLYFVEAGDIVLALVLFTVSNIGFSGGVHFYNSFLIDISNRSNMGTISGWGWGLGYVGGLLALLLAYPLIKGGMGEENLHNYRLTFPMTALFFIVFSIPAFKYLKERRGAAPVVMRGARESIVKGLGRVVETAREVRRFKELARYFIGYLVYTDGINTVIVFSAIFATGVLGFSPGEVIIYFVVTQVAAAIGAFAFGPVTDRVGAKRVIQITLVVWTVVAWWAYVVETKWGFYGLGVVAGTVLGANQSASRAMLGLFTPRGKGAEFFGFFAMVNKFAAVLGPLIYGEIAFATGSQRTAVLSLAFFFVAGFVILLFVNEEDGAAAARKYEAERGSDS